MVNVDVLILSQADLAAGQRLLPNATEANTVACSNLKLGIFEAGMSSGATSVMLAFVDPATGTNYVVETSANLFDGMAGAVRGAVGRFGK